MTVGDPAVLSAEDTQTDEAEIRIAAHAEITAKLRKLKISAEDPANKPVTFLILSEIQQVIQDHDLGLSEDEGYLRAGFRGRSDYDRVIQDAAYDLAIRYVNELKEAPGEITQLSEHPHFAWMGAYELLKASNRPLFDHQTYKPFGETRDSFFEKMRAAHLDCAAVKLRVLQAQIDGGTPDADGYNLLLSIKDTHYKALGLDTLDEAAAYQMRSTTSDIKAIEDYYHRWKFRDDLQQIAQIRKFNPHDIDYMWSVVNAWDYMWKYDDLLKSPEAFHQTGMNFGLFSQEFDRCIEGILRNYLQYVVAGTNKMATLETIVKELPRLRKIVGEYQDEEDLTLEEMRSDSWFQEIFREFGWESYTQFMEQSYQVVGAALANSVRSLRQDNAYNNLNRAVFYLREGHVNMEDRAALADLQIKSKNFYTKLRLSATQMLNSWWDNLHLNGATNEDKLLAITEMHAAMDHIYNTEYAGRTEFNSFQLNYRMNKIMKRRAEELFADSLMCLPDRFGAYFILDEAFDILDQMDMRIFNNRLKLGMGMSQSMARQLDRRHDVLSMVSLWKSAQDDTADCTERFYDVTSIQVRLNEHAEKNHHDVLPDFLRQADISDYEVFRIHHVSLARDVITSGLEELRYVDNDDKGRLRNAAQNILDAVSVINPEDPTNDFAFKRLTGLKHDSFMETFFGMAKDIEKSLTRVSEPFEVTNRDRARKIITRALKPVYHGEMAFRKMEAVARRLRADGKSITQPEILKETGIKAQDLKDFLDDQALRAARDHLDMATAAADFRLDLNNYEQHPYTDFVMALRWIGRTSYLSASDEPYQKLGFEGRRDFQIHMRDSLMDRTEQLEEAVKREGRSKGNLIYLKAMDEIRYGRTTLGLMNQGDIRRVMLDQKVAFGSPELDVGMDDMALASATAVGSVLGKEPDKSRKGMLGYQYKTVMGLTVQAVDLRIAKWTDLKEMKDEHFKTFDNVVKARIERLMELYKKHPGQAARGIRVASALETMCARHDLDQTEWFDAIFPEYGFADFESFRQIKASVRTRQIIERIQETISQETPEALTGRALNLTLYRDFKRIDAMVDDGDLPATMVDGNLEDLGYNREWYEVTKKLCASLALPLLMEQAQDPTLTDNKCLDALEEVREVMDLLGPKADAVSKLDQAKFHALREGALRRSASKQIMADLLRGTPDMVNGNVLALQGVLSALGKKLGDTDFLQELGATEEEAQAYAGLAPFTRLHQLHEYISDLSFADAEKIGEAVKEFFAEAEKQKIDVTDMDAIKKIGFISPEDFKERMDDYIFLTLNRVGNPMKGLIGKLKSMHANHTYIVDMLNETKIEHRYEHVRFNEMNAPTRGTVDSLMMQAYMQAAAGKTLGYESFRQAGRLTKLPQPANRL